MGPVDDDDDGDDGDDVGRRGSGGLRVWLARFGMRRCRNSAERQTEGGSRKIKGEMERLGRRMDGWPG